MVTRRTLTDIQKNMFRCIAKYQKEHGFSPNIRDLCEMTEVRSMSAVHAQLKAMEESGYIKRMRECSRVLAAVKKKII